MNVTASHVAGGGIGGIAAVVLAALGSRIGLHLTDADSAALALALLGVGGGAGHAFGKAWAGVGVFPSLRRGLFGAKAQKNTSQAAELQKIALLHQPLPDAPLVSPDPTTVL